MNLIAALVTLFLLFALMSRLAMTIGREYFESFQTTIVEMIDRSLSSQFTLLTASQLFWLYASLLLLVPVLFLVLEIPIIFCILLFLVLLLFPKVSTVIVATRRRSAIINTLPDALQQMSAALRAGATFNSAVQSLVAERDEPIAQEFSLLLRELRLGTSTDEALENLGERIKSEDVDIFVSAVQIAQSVGGDLADVLNRLSDTLRKKISMEARIKSLTAQGVMQGYVVTALPTVVMFALLLLEREAVEPLFTTLLGWIFLTAIFTLQFCGGWFIRKIVNIDI